MPELTEADMAEHRVTFITGPNEAETRSYVAAYIAADDGKMMGMLVFKDYQHRVVAMVNAGAVLTVERLERTEAVPPAPQPGGVTITKLTVPGAAGVPQTVYYPPETWSSYR